jgi:hypothetical protein
MVSLAPQPLYALPSGKTAADAYWIKSCMEPRASLDAVEKRKISCSYRESSLGRLARSPSPYRLGLILNFYNNYKHMLTFRDFSEANVIVKPVDSISVCVRAGETGP